MATNPTPSERATQSPLVTVGERVRRVGIYARRSRDDDETTSVERQVAAVREWCERRGWPVAEVYDEDRDHSASSATSRRPGFTRMTRDLDTGHVDTIVVWKLDRLARNLGQAEAFLEQLDRRKASFKSLSEDLIDTTTATGTFLLRLLVLLANWEAEQTGARLRFLHDALRRKGDWAGGGRRPFGLRLNPDESPSAAPLVADEAEREQIRAGVERLLAGDSLRSVVRDWNANGIKRPAGWDDAELPDRPGPEWDAPKLRDMLNRPRIAGARTAKPNETRESFEIGDALVISGDIPAMLDEQTWRKLHALLDSRAGTKSGKVRQHPLSGFAECGECGCRMYAATGRINASGERVYHYRCPSGMHSSTVSGCGKIQINARFAEDVLLGAMREALDNGSLAALLNEQTRSANLTDLYAELDLVESRLVEIDDARDSGKISRDRYYSRLGRLEQRRDAATTQIDALLRRRALTLVRTADELDRLWADGDAEQRQQLVRALVGKLTIKRGNSKRLDASRISIEWRG